MTTSSLSLSLDRLRAGGEAFMQEISREHYLTLAGLKALSSTLGS